MDLLNICGRYKTFREELPTKKFQFINESDSLHRLKVLHINANNQNKSNVADVDVKEEVPEEIEEPVVIEKIANTGMFRDRMRRIDVVLVAEDNQFTLSDSKRISFLTNVVKTGLEIEVEPGLMPAHKNLCFIKIHAPDYVLTEYGEIFSIKRFFIENHLDSTSLEFTRIEKKFHTVLNNTEKEWIKIIRNNYIPPNGLSNYERSLIVYKILLHLPFGEQANHFGIERLLERNIILAAYALHDGPYFFIPEQTVVGANARQILYYSWAGIQNIFKSQPLHLIHEYYGPTISFYFAFYGYFNKALAIAAIVGIINFLMPFAIGDEKTRDTICEDTRTMCAQCENPARCPERTLSEYCTPVYMSYMLDTSCTVYFSAFAILWGYIFTKFWKRREYFLKWMWELNGNDLYYKSVNRTKFTVGYKPLWTSKTTGLKSNENAFYKILRYVLTKGIVLLYIWSILPIMRISNELQDKFFDAIFVSATEEKVKLWDYVILAMFQSVYILVVSVLEKLCHYVSYIVVCLFENHRTYKAHEESLVSKEFGFSFISIYSFIAYTAWMVAGPRVHLGRCTEIIEKFNVMTILHNALGPWTISPWATENHCWRYCWPFTCINELCIMLAVTLFIKQVLFRIANYIMSLRTDYNRSKDDNATFPSWEREYTLNGMDDRFLFRKYHILAIQFTMVTVFVLSFPLAPLVVLLINIYDVRHTARQLLLSYRRPLLIRKPGIGAWTKALTFTAYIAIFTNAATLIFTTKLPIRYFMAFRNISTEDILDNFTYLMQINRRKQHYTCYSNDLLALVQDPRPSRYYHWMGFKEETTHGKASFLFNMYRSIIFVILIHIMGLLVYLIKVLVPPYSRDIKQTKIVEEKIKTLYYHYKTVSNSPKKTNRT